MNKRIGKVFYREKIQNDYIESGYYDEVRIKHKLLEGLIRYVTIDPDCPITTSIKKNEEKDNTIYTAEMCIMNQETFNLIEKLGGDEFLELLEGADVKMLIGWLRIHKDHREQFKIL